MMCPNKQSGSALLLALMVLALISGIATSILLAVQNEQSVVKRIQNNATVRQQLLGGEAWAQAWFKEQGSATQGNTQSVPFEQRLVLPGLMIRRTFKTDIGQLDVRVYDQQACINVNGLVSDTDSEITRQRLVNLSKQLGVGVGWIDVVKDWIDQDQVLSSGQGREDAFYQSKELGYRTSDKPLFSIEELALLDIPKASIKRLLPYLCALPKQAKFNINNVPEVVLKSVMPTITADQLAALNSRLQEGEVSSMDDLLSDSAFQGATLKADDWGVHSQFISVYVKLTTENDSYWLHSLLRKNKQGVVWSYARSFAPLSALSILKIKEDTDI